MKNYKKMTLAELRDEYKYRIGSYPHAMKKADFIRELEKADHAQSMSADELLAHLAANGLLRSDMPR